MEQGGDGRTAAPYPDRRGCAGGSGERRRRSPEGVIRYLAVLNLQADDQALVPYTLVAAARQ